MNIAKTVLCRVNEAGYITEKQLAKYVGHGAAIHSLRMAELGGMLECNRKGRYRLTDFGRFRAGLDVAQAVDNG